MSQNDATTLLHMISVASVIYVSFLLNSPISVTARGFSMKMIRSDSKESPLYRGDNLARVERLRGLVKQSKARARHFGSKTSYNESSVSLDIGHVPIKYEEKIHFYLGQVGIGNFGNQTQTFNNYYLVIDTGSDLTWTQCQGAISYFYQDAPLYPCQDSSTYGSISCDDHLDCSELFWGGYCDEEGYCAYKARYESRSVTFGDLVFETFTIISDTGAHESVDHKLIMGCGFEQRNFGYLFNVPDIGDAHLPPEPRPAPGKALVTGILGLGQGDGMSLVHQLGAASNGKFEYCLESFDSIDTESSETYLRFGSDTRIGEGLHEAVHTTSIIRNPHPNYGTQYHLILRDISVGGRKVGFQSRDFKIRKDGNGGSIIDSGAPFSVLYRPHFERVKRLVVEHFQSKGIHPVPVDRSISSEICFVIPANFNEFPSLTFHFQQADFLIEKASGIFTKEGNNKICFGILGIDGDNTYDFVFGAMQQTNKRILYDIIDMALSFTEEDCTVGS